MNQPGTSRRSNYLQRALPNGADSPANQAADSIVDLQYELEYWKSRRGLLPDGRKQTFAQYEPALKIAIDAYLRRRGRTLEQMEDGIRSRYARVGSDCVLPWSQVLAVISQCWTHMEQNPLPRPMERTPVQHPHRPPFRVRHDAATVR